MLIDALGWVAAVSAATVALPQVVRLLRIKTTAGISPVAWQTMLGGNLAWGAHGVFTGHPNIWLPNLVFAACSTTILVQLGRDRSVSGLRLLVPAVLLSAVSFAIDLMAGPIAFAAASVLPAALAQLAQLQKLITAPDVRGVSMAFLAVSVTNQVLWVSWALLVDERAVMLTGSSIGSLMLVNLIWATLRRLGLIRSLSLLST